MARQYKFRKLSDFQLTNTIGLRPTFGKTTVEFGFAYYSYPRSAEDLSYGEMYIAPTYGVTSKLTLGLDVHYGPNYYRRGAWENYDSFSGKYNFGHGLTLSGELGRQSFGTTDDRPPIKLPDYIYGNFGATYTYKSLSFDSCASMGRRCRDKAVFESPAPDRRRDRMAVSRQSSVRCPGTALCPS